MLDSVFQNLGWLFLVGVILVAAFFWSKRKGK